MVAFFLQKVLIKKIIFRSISLVVVYFRSHTLMWIISTPLASNWKRNPGLWTVWIKTPYIRIYAGLMIKNTQNSSQHLLIRRMRAWSMQISPKQTLQWYLLIGYEGGIGRQIFKTLVVKHVMFSFWERNNHWAFYLSVRIF